jgi:small-conductance mechanosensitive channel
MPRLKRSSAVLETARQRMAGLNTITPKPNFGPALAVDKYEQEVEALDAKLETYHETLSLLDRQQNELDEQEASVKDLNKRILAATGALYGPDSNEYEAVGGTRESDRKRPARKKTGES